MKRHHHKHEHELGHELRESKHFEMMEHRHKKHKSVPFTFHGLKEVNFHKG